MAQETTTMQIAGETKQVTLHTSAVGTLIGKDWIKAGIMGLLSTVIGAILDAINQGGLQFNMTSLKTIGACVVTAVGAYLIKQLRTDTKIVEVKQTP